MEDKRGAPLLRVEGLNKVYGPRGRFARGRKAVCALDNVHLAIPRGTTLALVGESGSGKSTLARCVVRLEEPTSGEVWYDGENVTSLGRDALRIFRRRMQLVFQDPGVALNPRLTAAEIVAEPLAIAGEGSAKEQRERAVNLMEQVGLVRSSATRHPAEFSGGQRQRLAIARALALEPGLLILDEVFSALDLSIQAQIANLLVELQAARKLTYLFITHDLSIAAWLADEVAVLHEGRIVEQGTPAELLRRPRHPQLKALVAALPALDPPGAAPERG